MEGGPSHLDLYDYKPELRKRFNQDLPDSIRKGQRLTTMTSGQSRFPIAPSVFRFARCENQTGGVWLSELLPHTQQVANELCFIHSMHTEAINHEPGITFFQTGNQQPGRPSFGSWLSYGLGSANANLPTFAVMITQGQGNMQALAARFWGSGFLPSEHQGCKLRSSGDPVLYLKDPPGVARLDRRRMLDLVGALDEKERRESLDDEIDARVAQAEMAYRMQMSVPELADFRRGRGDARDVRARRAQARQLRGELPARATAGGTRRAFHPALHARLGPARRFARGDQAADAGRRPGRRRR
jgi:hypothetical protein